MLGGKGLRYIPVAGVRVWEGRCSPEIGVARREDDLACVVCSRENIRCAGEWTPPPEHISLINKTLIFPDQPLIGCLSAL